jgi:hypothetical protein
MAFDKFGVVSFTSEGKTADFITYLEQGKVMASRCKKCGATYFPPQMDCSRCLSGDAEWVEISGEGKLITYSIVNYGPAGFEDDAPYTLAIVDFKGGLRVFGRLSRELKEDEIKIGMALKCAVLNLPDNRISYEFVKA